MPSPRAPRLPRLPWAPRLPFPFFPAPTLPTSPVYPRDWFSDLLPGIGLLPVLPVFPLLRWSNRPGDVVAPTSPEPQSIPQPPRISPPVAPPAPMTPEAPRTQPQSGKDWGRDINWERARDIAREQIQPSERSGFDFGPGQDDWYQCTVWAKARWREMGYSGPPWYGDGADVAANINRLLGRPNATAPTVGAIVSMPDHVAVVEEVRTLANGHVEFRVSEMNMGGNGWQTANPDEFRDDRWVPVGAGQVFAPFPS